MYLFIQLHWVLSEACGIFSCGTTILCLVAECVIQFPDYGLNPGSLHWESWGLTTEPYGKSSPAIVQFSVSVVSDSLRPHELQHARSPCPSPTPGVYSNSCPLSQWCHPAISPSVIRFSSCPQSLPALGSFPMSQFFAWGGQSIAVSALASELPKNTQDWSPLKQTGWNSLKSKGITRAISNTIVQKHQLFSTQHSIQSNSHIHTWPLEKP